MTDHMVNYSCLNTLMMLLGILSSKVSYCPMDFSVKLTGNCFTYKFIEVNFDFSQVDS